MSEDPGPLSSKDEGEVEGTDDLVDVPLTWPDFLPTGWGFAEGNSDAWIECYRMFLVSREDITGDKILTLDVLDSRLVLLYGTPNYIDPGVMKIKTSQGSGPILVEVTKAEEKTAPLGAYAIIATKYPTDPAPKDEPAARIRVKKAMTLARLLLGRNIAFDKLFEHTVNSQGRFRAATPGIEQPAYFGPPLVNEERLGLLERVAQTLEQLPAKERNRADLAIRWISDAMTSGGVDHFLRIWTALETLAMPDTTNVRPMNEMLSRAYKISFEEAASRFQVGRICNLRGDILHQGLRPPVHKVAAYMQSLFEDVLLEFLGLETLRSAENALGEMDWEDFYLEVKSDSLS